MRLPLLCRYLHSCFASNFQGGLMMKDRARLLWLPVTAWMLTHTGLAQAHDADRPAVTSNVDTFAVPPKTAQVWSITSASGRHGTMSRWTAEDGVIWSRKSF